VHGVPLIEDLRRALLTHFSEFQWKWKIIGAGKEKFLVQFSNSFRLGLAVKESLIKFPNFAGYFMAWSEDLNAINKFKEVFVWVRLIGFPFQC